MVLRVGLKLVKFGRKINVQEPCKEDGLRLRP